MKIFKISQSYTVEVAKTTKDPNILTNILKRNNNDEVSCYAAYNPNCPPEALAEVLKRNNNDNVSYLAARNPSCPPLARIRWMQNTGQIAKEDPTKHYIEYEEEKPDKDLEELKKLIGK